MGSLFVVDTTAKTPNASTLLRRKALRAPEVGFAEDIFEKAPQNFGGQKRELSYLEHI